MKSVKYLVVALVVVALAACNIGLGSQDAIVSDADPLPDDIVRDVARSTGGEFTFETVIPVQLNVEVDLYTLNDLGLVAGPTEHMQGQNTYVFFDDSEGNRVFSAKADEDGIVNATLVLPAAPEDMMMTVVAEGFGERVVPVSSMVNLEKVDRTMSMGRFQEYESNFLARQLTGLEDSDGDGVPDAYDAFPYDWNSAFESRVPADGKLTIAFEDLFGEAQAGDADYNDFVAAYSVTEVLNSDGLVTSLTIDADAVEKLAGYDHEFGIRIDSFEGEATLSGSYIDESGGEQPLSDTVVAPAEIVLFENSRNAVGKSASFTLEFSTPQQHASPDGSETGDVVISRLPLPVAPYNPFAIVRNTSHDIHLIGREPLTEIVDSINPDDTFRDEAGYPWALLVPPVMVGDPPVAEGWDAPAETERIDSDDWYPRFTNWRESGGERFTDWYLYYREPYEPAVKAPAALTGIDPQPLAGNPVVYPESQTYQLLSGEGTTPAYYRSVDPLPAWITVAETTGAVNVSSDAADPPLSAGEQRQETVEFYTSDNDYPADDDTSGSTLNEPLSVTFAIERGAVVVEPDVYAAGYYDTDSKRIASYWMNGSKKELSVPATAGDAQATDIFVVLNADGTRSVYVAGWYVDNDTSNRIAAYWLDGNVTPLSTSNVIGEASGIYVENDVVYVSGTLTATDYQSEQAVYWVNGGENILYDGARYGVASEIAVRDGTVYVPGYFNNTTISRAAGYWSATGPVDLSGDATSQAWDIDVSPSGQVFVAGTVIIGLNYASAYWVDGAAGRQVLYSDPTAIGNPSRAYGIDEVDGSVYTAGYYRESGTQYAAYWQDTARVNLSTGSASDRATDIAVVNDVPYVVGAYQPADRLVAALWTPDGVTDLYDSGLPNRDAEAVSVFVLAP